MSTKNPDQIVFPFAEGPKPVKKIETEAALPEAQNGVSLPPDGSRERKNIGDEGPECQYCSGGGPCIYCDRGKQEIARLKLERASRHS